MADLKVGMKVLLKSGGPLMTIVKIDSKFKNPIFCQWFSENKVERSSFPPEALDIHEEEQEYD